MSTPTPPSGWVLVSVPGFGTPIEMPTLTTILSNWFVENTQNIDILALVNEGYNSPTALYNGCIAYAQSYVGYGVVPDGNLKTTLVWANQINTAAGTVPLSQWSASTYNYSGPSTIAAAVAAAAPPPPTPPASNVLVSSCYPVGPYTICYAGPGVTAVTATSFTYLGAIYPNGQTLVDQSSGKSYTASITPEADAGMGPSICFYPATS